MQTLREVEETAMRLSQTERARLAARLLDSLPAVLSDKDDGISEAFRRDAEMDADPTKGITLDELKRAIQG